MTNYAYIECPIAGESPDAGFEGQIRVHEMSVSSALPVSELDNNIKGRRTRQPFIFRAETGKHTPGFYQHLFNNLEMADLTVHMVKPDIKGDQFEYFTIKFKELKVIKVGSYKMHVHAPHSGNYVDEDEIALVYGEVTYCYNEDGIEVTDRHDNK